MDKSDLILAAIEQLGTSLGGRMDRLEAEVAVLKEDVAVLKAGQARILEHLDVAELKGRVEELSRRLPVAVGVYQPPGRPAAE